MATLETGAVPPEDAATAGSSADDAAATAGVEPARLHSVGPAGVEPRVIDTVNDAFVAVDGGGAIVEWNRQAERTFGWARHEVVGRSLDEAVVVSANDADRKGGPAKIAGAGSALSLGEPHRVSVLHRYGHVLPIEVTVWASPREPRGDGRRYHAVLRDLSHEDEVERERARLAAIVESSEEAIVGLGPDGRVLTWNRGSERLFGYTLAQVKGKPAAALVPPDHADELARLERRARAGSPVRHVDTKALRSNGLVLEVSVTISPVYDAGGAVAGTSLVVRDVTEQRWMARTLDATLASLESALKEAKDSEARLRRLTGDAAHQLRTPIAGIQACAESLFDDPPPEERDALLAEVIRETSRAARLMTGLLQMARLDQGHAVAPVRCDLARLCTEEVERARTLAPHLELGTTVGEVPRAWPDCDPHAIREILANLLDNARRHAASRIEVSVGACGDHVEVKVADDGPGVPDAMAKRIFERFVSVDGKGGSGLGLPIARALAQAHGGDLYYERPAFVLRLPQKSRRDCGGSGRPDFEGPEAKPAANWEELRAP